MITPDLLHRAGVRNPEPAVWARLVTKNAPSKGSADYRCLSCAHEWAAKPGPVTCPDCGHLYVKWTNYEERRW